MIRRVRLERGDFALGAGAIALAAVYLVAARAIPAISKSGVVGVELYDRIAIAALVVAVGYDHAHVNMVT